MSTALASRHNSRVPCPRLPWACPLACLLALGVLITFAAPLSAEEPDARAPASKQPASKQPAAKKKASSLDDDLLRGLGDDPLKELEPPADPEPAKPGRQSPSGKKSPGKPASKSKPAVTPLDEDLLRNLEGGEDRAAGDADSNDPLVRLNRQMRQAEELLRARKSDDPTQQLQGKIVSELEELIKQLQQQQQQQSSSSSGSKKPQQTAKRESVSQPQQQKGSSPAKSAPKPARDSSDRVGKAETKKADPGKLSDLIKDIWGELPARLRQQMMQSSAEQFVPKYELQIEEYFKTLSEKKQEK